MAYIDVMQPTSEKLVATPLRIALGGAVAVAFLGALYLYVVRGQALLLDLASDVAGLFCL
jgi:hypothetical protein